MPRAATPPVAALQAYVLSAGKLHADDTPVPVLAPGEGQTRTGRLWTYVRDDRPAGDTAAPAVWFAYSPNRRGEHPQGHLKAFTGILQADAYAGFGPLYANGTVREAACWAHVRRKFYDLHKAQASPLAAEALQRIGTLYAIEADIRGKPTALRQTERQARAGPVLLALREWLDATLRGLSQKSALAEAIRYALARWEALVRYSTDGRIEIDNNAAERALRTVAIGRNYVQSVIMLSRGQRAALSAASRPCRLRIIKGPAGTSTVHQSAGSVCRVFQEARSRPRRAPSWPGPLRRSHASSPDSRARATGQ